MRRKRKPAPTGSEQALRGRLLHALARLAGRDPAALTARELPDGRLEVRSPCAVAQYEPTGWWSRLCRHLHRGYFDPPAQASMVLSAAQDGMRR